MDIKTEPEEEDGSSQPVLLLTPDCYPDSEALIDVKVKLECPDISQIETKPDLSSTLITCNLSSLTNIPNESFPVITSVYSIHGGNGFDGNNDHSNSLKSQSQEQEDFHHEYQEVIRAPPNPKLNLSLNSQNNLVMYNPINNSTSYVCSYCFNAFPSSTELENHIKNIHEQTEFECTLCTNRRHHRSIKYGNFFHFSSMESLNQHMKAVHNINSTIENQSHGHEKNIKAETVSEPPTPTDYMCEDCYKTYSRKLFLILHTSKTHGKLFYCNFCCKSFTQKYDFYFHSESSSLVQFVGKSRGGKTELDCKICFKPIKSQCEVYIHTKCHLKSCQQPLRVGPKVHNPNFECDLCLRTFESELYFVNHKRLAHPNSEWKCSRCPDYFTTYFECRSHRCSSLLLKNIPERLVHVDDDVKDHISNCSSENPHDDVHSFHKEHECNEIESVIETPAPARNITNKTVHYVTCDVCFATFLTDAGLLCHKRKHHRIYETPRTISRS